MMTRMVPNPESRRLEDLLRDAIRSRDYSLATERHSPL